MHEGSRAISKELPPARERGGRGQASRDTDTDTGRPRSPPQAEGRRSAPLPAPLRSPAPALAPRSAEPPPTERGASRPPSPLSLLRFGGLVLVFVGFCCCRFYFLSLEAPGPPFWGGLPVGRPLSRVSLRPLFGDVPGDCCCLCY